MHAGRICFYQAMHMHGVSWLLSWALCDTVTWLFIFICFIFPFAETERIDEGRESGKCCTSKTSTSRVLGMPLALRHRPMSSHYRACMEDYRCYGYLILTYLLFLIWTNKYYYWIWLLDCYMVGVREVGGGGGLGFIISKLYSALITRNFIINSRL